MGFPSNDDSHFPRLLSRVATIVAAVIFMSICMVRTDAQIDTRESAGTRQPASAGTLLFAASFAGSATTANRYVYGGGTCITAGTSTVTTTEVPGCGSKAPLDPPNNGALQLTQPISSQAAFLATTPAFSTANGLVIQFTDYSFGGTSPSGSGITAFLTDASKPLPAKPGQGGGSLGYANATGGSGLAGAYLGIGFDESGNFSSPTGGRVGGPGTVPETIAIRGAATTNWAYLTGASVNGHPASLPFHFDDPAVTKRPATAPTVQITLTPAGLLSVAVNNNDGNGFVTYVPATKIVGLNGQPAVPASVHFGFSASTGTTTSRHQTGVLTISTIGTGPTPTPTPIPTAPPASQDNTTYHNNNLRTGWYQHETTLTTANVASSAFHLIGTLTTAGKSYSQPLYLSAQTIADGTVHNVLIITDSTDVVYAYDADTLAPLWKRDFKGTGVRQQLASDIDCDDTWPNIGINGTPVVDRARNRMYVVVPTNDNGTAHLRLHAISLANGVDSVAPVEVSASVTLASGGTASVDPRYNFDRAGLLETNNTIYVPLSTHCDFDPNASHGWLLAYNPDTLAAAEPPLDSTNKNIGSSSGSDFLGSIWQGGFAIAADAESNIFFATGNGPNDDGGSDYAMSVLKLPPTLNESQRQFFTPNNWLTESKVDGDLGSGGVMLLPDQTTGAYVHLAVAGGKDGEKFLLNRDNLGGLNTPDQVLYEADTANGIWGGPAYFVDPTGTQKIFYGGTPSLNAYTLTTSPTYALTLTSRTTVGQLENRNAGVTPVVSSNGTQAGTGIVWAIKTPNGFITGTGEITLYAFDATNLATTLFSATAGQWTENGNTGGAMITPLVANGRVYLASDGVVSVFGIH